MPTTWTQETVGDSGITTTTSTPDTTWTTELIGANIAGDSLTVDSIIIDGTTIGHTDDTDILEFGSGGVLQVNGSLAALTSVNTNTIRNLIGGNVITFSDTNTTLVGDLTISGGNITNAITCDSTLTATGIFTSNNRAIFNGTLVSLGASCPMSIASVLDSTDNTGSDGSIYTKGGMSIAKKLYVGTDLDVDGVTNLDAVDIDGNVQLDGAFTVGVDDAGQTVKFFGDTSGKYMQWDTSRDSLILSSSSRLYFHDFGGEYIYAPNDGNLNLYCDTNMRFEASHIIANSSFNIIGAAQFDDDLTIGASGAGEALTCWGNASDSSLKYNVEANIFRLSNTTGYISKGAVGKILNLNNTAAAGVATGPDIDLFRGTVGVAGTAGGKLGKIHWTGTSNDNSLTGDPYGSIYVESTVVTKNAEDGKMFINVNVDGAETTGILLFPDNNGHIDTFIGHHAESLCTIQGDLKVSGNDIKSSTGAEGTVCISFGGASGDETTIQNLLVEDECVGDFDFVTDDAVIKMTGDDQWFLMDGNTPKMRIGKSNESNQSSGFLELGYASGTADVSSPADVGLPGIINLCKKSGSGGGNAYLWVDSSGDLRIAGSMPHGYSSHSNYYETHGVKVADQ